MIENQIEDAEIVDAIPVETVQDPRDSIVTVDDPTEEEHELTPEEKEQQEKFMRGMVIRRFRGHLVDIYARMKKTGQTLEELREEVYAKVSPLTVSRREFLTGFKVDFIQQLLDDMYNSNEAN